jgi:ligand-binding SRPBCC domain-containing protein
MYQLRRKQLVKTDIATCWDFFSSPANLSKITPTYMGFDVRSEVPERMYEGLMIEYRVRPLLGIPMKWVTEITHVKDYQFFVDEQRIGPYKIWHHEHHFMETPEGIEMTDIVSYVLPFGVLGTIVHPFLVEKKLNEIFAHRFKVVDELFK